MSPIRSATDVTATAQPTEQEDNDDDNHEQTQDAAQSPAAIIPPTMTVIAATAEQQDEHDNKQYERHRMDIPSFGRDDLPIATSRTLLVFLGWGNRHVDTLWVPAELNQWRGRGLSNLTIAHNAYTDFILTGRSERQSVASLRHGLPVTPSKIIWPRLSRVHNERGRAARRWLTCVLSAQLRKFDADGGPGMSEAVLSMDAAAAPDLASPPPRRQYRDGDPAHIAQIRTPPLGIRLRASSL
jgi:hypothetical protein